MLAPKKLAENWTNYNANLTTNIFAEDRFNYDVLAHTDLSRTRGESMGMRARPRQLGQLRPRRHRRVAQLPQRRLRRGEGVPLPAPHAAGRSSEGVKTKVLMLSATPVNNRFTDLQEPARARLRGRVGEPCAKHLEHLDDDREDLPAGPARVQRVVQAPAEERTTEAILKMLDFDFFELLDAVTIARSRKHIQAFYDTTEIGAFPERLPTDLDPARR